MLTLAKEIKTIYDQYTNKNKINLFKSPLKNKIIAKYISLVEGNLNKLIYDIKEISNEEIIKNRILSFLADNWNLIKGTFLSYTSLPYFKVTTLMIELAKLLSKYYVDGNNKKIKFANEILMPTVCFESIDNNYPHLKVMEYIQPKFEIKEIDPLEIIKTHISSKNGNMLIPIRMLLYADSNESEKFKFKPYYDVFDEDETAELTNDEKFRIENHSNVTQQYKEALDKYNKLLLESDNLLDKLEVLAKKLHLSSKDSPFGNEEIAGELIYLSLSEFETYYNLLTPEVKIKIPDNVNKVINSLFSIASNKDRGIESCVKTIRTNLISIISSTDIKKKLSEIKLGSKTKQKLIETSRKNLEDCKKYLIESLQNPINLNNCSDHLDINYKLLKKLNIQLEIDTLDDLEEVIKIKEDNLKEFFNDAEIKKQFLKPIKEFEDLCVFLVLCPDDKFELFLKFLNDEGVLKNLSIDNIISIIILQEKKLNRIKVINSLFKLNEQFKSVQDITRLLGLIDKSHADYFEEILGHKITELYDAIKTVDDIRFFFLSIHSESSDKYLKKSYNKICIIIKTGYDFKSIIGALDSIGRKAFFNNLQSHLKTISRSGSDINDIMFFLNREDRITYFDLIKDNLKNITFNDGDFKKLAPYLNHNHTKYLAKFFVLQYTIHPDYKKLRNNLLCYSVNEDLLRETILEAIIENNELINNSNLYNEFLGNDEVNRFDKLISSNNSSCLSNNLLTLLQNHYNTKPFFSFLSCSSQENEKWDSIKEFCNDIKNQSLTDEKILEKLKDNITNNKDFQLTKIYIYILPKYLENKNKSNLNLSTIIKRNLQS